MRDAHAEIKSTVSVNTSDMAAKAYEDKTEGKDFQKISRRHGFKTNGLAVSEVVSYFLIRLHVGLYTIFFLSSKL